MKKRHKVPDYVNIVPKNLCHAIIFTHGVKLSVCWTLDGGLKIF